MNTNTIQQQLPTNTILHGDCIEKMREMPANSVDFILTDPPYLVNYRDRDGRTIQNDAKADWLKPAMAEAYRVLKQDRVAIMFYGWTKIDAFFDAWKDAGFQPVGHIVFITTPKPASSPIYRTSRTAGIRTTWSMTPKPPPSRNWAPC